MYSTDYMDRARTRAGAYIHSATKSDVHAHAKKSMPSEKRAAGTLAATRRLLENGIHWNTYSTAAYPTAVKRRNVE